MLPPSIRYIKKALSNPLLYGFSGVLCALMSRSLCGAPSLILAFFPFRHPIQSVLCLLPGLTVLGWVSAIFHRRRPVPAVRSFFWMSFHRRNFVLVFSLL